MDKRGYRQYIGLRPLLASDGQMLSPSTDLSAAQNPSHERQSLNEACLQRANFADNDDSDSNVSG